jgi:hypothetical protein
MVRCDAVDLFEDNTFEDDAGASHASAADFVDSGEPHPARPRRISASTNLPISSLMASPISHPIANPCEHVVAINREELNGRSNTDRQLDELIDHFST